MKRDTLTCYWPSVNKKWIVPLLIGIDRRQTKTHNHEVEGNSESSMSLQISAAMIKKGQDSGAWYQTGNVENQAQEALMLTGRRAGFNWADLRLAGTD